jgi:hypothetical protein
MIARCASWLTGGCVARPVDALIARWRENISTLQRCGCAEAATTLGSCVTELEAALVEEELESLTLAEAVEQSGFSYSSLQKRLASGQLENIGQKGSPRIRRKDLPIKAGIRDVAFP